MTRWCAPSTRPWALATIATDRARPAGPGQGCPHPISYAMGDLSMPSLQILTTTDRASDRALSDVSFHLPKGHVVDLIGTWRAGTSTPIRCMTRLAEATLGPVMLKGLDVTGLGHARSAPGAPPHRNALSGMRTGRVRGGRRSGAAPRRHGPPAAGAVMATPQTLRPLIPPLMIRSRPRRMVQCSIWSWRSAASM